MDIMMDILFCAIISGLLTLFCYCVYVNSRAITIHYLDRELIVGDFCYDVSTNREVFYCGTELSSSDNNFYAIVVYTEKNTVYIYNTLPGSLLILREQE